MARRTATKVSPIRETPEPQQLSPERIELNGPALEYQPTEQEIRQRAFEIYSSGALGSRDSVEIWLQAERELRARHFA